MNDQKSHGASPSNALDSTISSNSPQSASPEFTSPVKSRPLGEDCKICCKPCTRLFTRSSNRNGNAGRPYYKCIPCDKFICFDDARGIDAENSSNPPCNCGQISRRQITNREKGRRIFYVCATAACKFFEWHKNKDGSEWSVEENVVEALQRLRVI